MLVQNYKTYSLLQVLLEITGHILCYNTRYLLFINLTKTEWRKEDFPLPAVIILLFVYNSEITNNFLGIVLVEIFFM